MKTGNRILSILSRQGLPARVLVLLSMTFVLLQCRKKEKAVNAEGNALQAFVQSAVYKDFLQRNASIAAAVDLAAGRVVPFGPSLCTIHIPVMEKQRVKGVIVALPRREKGRYELIYQDNKAALSGTGPIYVRTSKNEPFSIVHLSKGKITKVEPVYHSGESASRTDDPAGCNFFCRLDNCYNQLKAKFPGDAVCALLDILMGVCTVATITSCLIRMTIG